MSTYYFAINAEGEHIFDNFPSNLKHITKNYIESTSPIDLNIEELKIKARIGKRSNSFGTIYTLTFDKKYVDRYKLFKELLGFSIISLESLANFHKSILIAQTVKTEELIHNITSLNTYSIQNLYSLIPQRTLSENINKQKDIIRGIISEKPNVTTDTLLKLIKYNLSMKLEFSVFERTQNPNAPIKKISHSIRNIVLSILQIFVDDFENKKIEVSLDSGSDSERRLEIDDDSLFVSLFYLLENSVKYCCPNTRYKIHFKEESDCFSISFNMISIKIETYEIAKLTDYGYRSDFAKKINLEGKGIGMFRIVKTLKFNDAKLEIIPRIGEYVKINNDIIYENNQFKIKFMGQQDWFKINTY